MVSDEVKGIIYMAVNETKPLSPVEIHDKIKSKCDVTLQEVEETLLMQEEAKKVKIAEVKYIRVAKGKGKSKKKRVGEDMHFARQRDIAVAKRRRSGVRA